MSPKKVKRCDICGTDKNVKIIQHLATVKTIKEEIRIRRATEEISGKHIPGMPWLCSDCLKRVRDYLRAS